MTESLPEQALNRLLRRVDWRFLVPSADGPSTVAYDGGSDLAAALQTFAPNVAELGAAPLNGADVAVGNCRSDLRGLRRSLRPAGTGVVEWRAPGGPGASIVERRLAHAGLGAVEAYWAWPPPPKGLPRFWLPLGSPAAAAYLLDSRPAVEAPLEQAKRGLRDAAWGVAARAGLLAPVYVLARSEPPEGDPVGLPALIGNPPALRWLLVTQGGRSINKVLALPFAEPDPRPLALVKIARVADSDAMLEREVEVLREVQRLALDLTGAPAVLAAGRVAGRAAVAETFLGGNTVSTRLRPDTFPELAPAAAGWVSRLVVQGPPRPRSEWWSRLVAAPLATFRERFGPVAAAADLRATEERLLLLPDLPRAIEHRDFSPWNVALGADGALVVHDWESGEPHGLPVSDLVYFLTYAAFFLERSLESGRLEEAYAMVWNPGTAVGRLAADALDVYLSRAGVERAAVPPLRLLTWIVHAAGEYKRLRADTGEPPTAEALQNAVFFRLWHAELRSGTTG